MNFFSNSGGYEDLKRECSGYDYEKRESFAPEDFPAEKDIIFCLWDEDSYEGSFFMLYRHGGKVYEMQMSHCSCNSYGEADMINSWTLNLNTPINREYLMKRSKPYYVDSPEREVAWDAALELVDSALGAS